MNYSMEISGYNSVDPETGLPRLRHLESSAPMALAHGAGALNPRSQSSPDER